MTPPLDLPPPPPSVDAIRVLSGPGLRDVLAERVAQIDEHGFTPAHDLGHNPHELALAAAAYLAVAVDQLATPPIVRPDDDNLHIWPWEPGAWRPGDVRANLIKAVAIAWAVIDRLDAGSADLAPIAPMLIGQGGEVAA